MKCFFVHLFCDLILRRMIYPIKDSIIDNCFCVHRTIILELKIHFFFAQKKMHFLENINHEYCVFSV